MWKGNEGGLQTKEFSKHRSVNLCFGMAICTTALVQCMVRRLTAREKLRDEKVCVNVFVNKGEDVVKDKDVLPAA
jgi:hypothetical protein